VSSSYDLVVIGAGTAGRAPAVRSAQAGLRVAVIDSRPYGGTCALRGCQPKKILVSAADVVERHFLMKDRGLAGSCSLDWPALIRFKDAFTGQVPEKKEQAFAEAGVAMYHGRATFLDKNRIRVNEDSIMGKRFVIATGSRPAPLSFPGAEHLNTSDDFFDLKDMPGSVVFVGGGYISFELAHVAHWAGAEVSILEGSSQPLSGFEPDLVRVLVEQMEETGISVQCRRTVREIERQGDGELLIRAAGEGESRGEEFAAHAVVHGAGRIPDLEALHPERAGVEYDRTKGVVVNGFMQSVSNPRVYAAGDAAAGGLPLLAVASMEGEVVAGNLLEGNSRKADYSVIPSVVFTFPPLSAVGLTEVRAREEGLRFDVIVRDTSSLATSRRIGLKRSGSKVLIEHGSERILGAHLLGYHAEDVINVFALAIKAGLPSSLLREILWAYPTAAADMDSILA
jgi:glutathione reductase (NADPH)